MESLSEQLNVFGTQVQSGFFNALSAAQIIGYILTVIFLFGAIWSIIALSDVRKKREEAFDDHIISQAKKTTLSPRMKQWQNITNAIMSDNDQLWRVAIIDADTMLEEMVRGLGYQGLSFGEVLKSLPAQTPWLDAAWRVHRLRNTLAHEGSRYTLTHREVYQAYKVYESILYENGYLS